MPRATPTIERLPDQSDHVLVFRNPTAGSGRASDRLGMFVQALRQNDLRVDVVSDVSELQRQTEEPGRLEGLRAVVAAGGDGTADLVANVTPPSTPLTVFPLGTENLLAKLLMLTSDPVEAARTLAAGHVARLDAGAITCADNSERLFLLMLGCGFDADVVHRLHRERRGNISHFSYAKPILGAIRSYEYPPLRVCCYDEPAVKCSDQITAHFVFVFNAPSYATGLSICPKAVPYDGYLDVVTFEAGSFWKAILHLSAIMLGRHQNLPGVRMVRTRMLEIEAEQPVPFQVDGDPGGHLPLSVRVLPERLRMVVPQTWIDRQTLSDDKSLA